jgi:TPR repeat protein
MQANEVEDPASARQGSKTMAFSDVEIQGFHAAVSAPQPHPEDLYRLGLIYSTGQGAPLDLVEAHKWFNLAALRGWDAAKHCRKELADQMSSAEIAAAQRAAREWMSRPN